MNGEDGMDIVAVGVGAHAHCPVPLIPKLVCLISHFCFLSPLFAIKKSQNHKIYIQERERGRGER